MCAVFQAVSYNQKKVAEIPAMKEVEKASVRTIYLCSYIDSSLDDDPDIQDDESVRVAQAEPEPMSKHDSILVKLLTQTPPFTGNRCPQRIISSCDTQMAPQQAFWKAGLLLGVSSSGGKTRRVLNEP